MRIVHVVQGLGIGGQERLVVHLSHELAARGHEPAIVSLSPGGEVRSEAAPIPIYDATRCNGPDLSLVARLAVLFRSLRPDVVHTHNPAPMLHAVPAALLARIPRRVHTKHGANVYGRRGLWAARAAVRAIDAVVAVSEQTADIARIKERVPERRLRVVLNGIPLHPFGRDPSARARVRTELGIAQEAFVVGSVGRLAPEKDYPRLIAAVAPLLSERVRLVLVGAGPARGEIERAIRAISGGRYVVLTGARSDVPALLAAFDMFVLSSRTEGLPLAVPEAMASGLPVVATAVGGLPSVVPSDCGVLVPPRDDVALHRIVRDLARDPGRVAALGEAARRRARAGFSIVRMADAYEDIYHGN